MNEIIKYRGFEIETHQDDCDEDSSPRNWDNLGTMVCFHGKYNLGDDHNFKNPEELSKFMDENKVFSLPIYMYDHSGIGISSSNKHYPFNCPWDSGQLGYVFTTGKKAVEFFGGKKLTKAIVKKIYESLQQEMDTYNEFLSGEVYGYYVQSIDSCTGYYGEEGIKTMIQEAKDSIDFHIKEQVKKHCDKLKTLIKRKVPLDYRQTLTIG